MPILVSFTCRHCQTPQTVKSGNKERHFCNSMCQQLFLQKQMTDNWLATGFANSQSLSHSNNYIKRYLLQSQNQKCACCQHDNIWQNKELIFILDHIDGNSNNNDRNNLRLICPNCNSQLPTFAGRNKGSGRHYRRQRYANGLSS